MDAKRQYQFHPFLPQPFLAKGSGIYALVNRNNLKVYIGSAVILRHRWTAHRSDLSKKKHNSRYFQRAFDKEPDAFYIEVIEELPNAKKEVLLAREQFWINFFKSYLPKNGYNICPKAESCQGIKRDPEYVARVAASLRGYKHTPEARANMRLGQKGVKRKPHSERVKAILRTARLGKTHSPETRLKISKAHKENPYQARAVLQFSLDGKFIARHKTMKSAAAAIGVKDSHGANIGNTCRGKRRFAYGYVWKFAEEANQTDTIPVRPRTIRKDSRLRGQKYQMSWEM